MNTRCFIHFPEYYKLYYHAFYQLEPYLKV